MRSREERFRQRKQHVLPRGGVKLRVLGGGGWGWGRKEKKDKSEAGGDEKGQLSQVLPGCYIGHGLNFIYPIGLL